MDEDCLFLNVYSPDVGSGVEGAPFPVLFYIHDGDFIHGASHQFPPHQLVSWYKLVVVTVSLLERMAGDVESGTLRRILFLLGQFQTGQFGIHVNWG